MDRKGAHGAKLEVAGVPNWNQWDDQSKNQRPDWESRVDAHGKAVETDERSEAVDRGEMESACEGLKR